MKYLVGVGNYSMFDDSIGLKIVEYLAANSLDNGFQLIDLSANLINLLFYFDPQTTQIIVIDSAKMGLPAGEYRFFSLAEVTSIKKQAGISTHEGDLIGILQFARSLGYHVPTLKMMGIEPRLIKNEFGLSRLLEEKIPYYCEQVIKEFDSDMISNQ